MHHVKNVNTDEPDDDETDTEGLDDGGFEEEDGDLDFEDEGEDSPAGVE